MELILTALINAIILYWGRGGSSGDKELETHHKSQANSKFTSSPPPPLPPTFLVTINLLSTVFFTFQAERVLMYMVLF